MGHPKNSSKNTKNILVNATESEYPKSSGYRPRRRAPLEDNMNLCDRSIFLKEAKTKDLDKTTQLLSDLNEHEKNNTNENKFNDVNEPSSENTHNDNINYHDEACETIS